MTELAQRLYEMRKAHNLSQEELADKLNVSRQAVSKWECGDSSPDTDNLIALSELYGVSLDELVRGANSKAAEEKRRPTEDEFFVGRGNADDTDDDYDFEKQREAEEHRDEKRGKARVERAKRDHIAVRLLYGSLYPLAATIGFLLWGFLGNGWYISWTLFLTIPLYYAGQE